MPYSEYVFSIAEPEKKETLIAVLENLGFEGFEETDETLKAYIPQNEFSTDDLSKALENFSSLKNIRFQRLTIPDQNWNALWEKSYEPVVVKNEIAVLSSFHAKIPGVKYEIIIDPKMSFGTGHHATTMMMLEMILEEDIKGKAILDFGSGTGILSILAAKMGAKEVVAVDHEDWAFENMKENFEKNGVTKIFPILGDESKIPNRVFDCIFANVNRNIIMNCMETLVRQTAPGGKILFSGIMHNDENEILQLAKTFGLELESKKTKEEWLCLKMLKTRH